MTATDLPRLPEPPRPAVLGFCPMGCGRTLQLLRGGAVNCVATGCPRPSAATDLLLDAETDHVLELRRRSYTLRHPLRERLEDGLMTCSLQRLMEAQTAPPLQPGRYRGHLQDDGSVDWDPLPAHPAPVGYPRDLL